MMTAAEIGTLHRAMLNGGKALGMVPGETRSDYDPRLQCRGLPQHDWHVLLLNTNSLRTSAKILTKHFGSVAASPEKYRIEFEGDIQDLSVLIARYARKLQRALAR